jgi:predicted alpha/beta-fold hydrolase
LFPIPKEKYYDYFVDTARQFTNIHFIELVETVKIVQIINNFDMVYILKKHGFNSVHALTNEYKVTL